MAPGEAPVFVNEVHYDNDGTDAGETIEIAGPAGTDLTGWSIVLYNGTGGAAYGTRVLAGTIPDQQDGFGTASFTYPSNGIQNGSPDGIALVDGAGQVVQLLSYEGSFPVPHGGCTAGPSRSRRRPTGHGAGHVIDDPWLLYILAGILLVDVVAYAVLKGLAT